MSKLVNYQPQVANGSIDYNSYTNIHHRYNSSNPNLSVGTTTTILDITGQGWIDNIYLLGTGGVGSYFEIFKDGVSFMKCNAASNNNWIVTTNYVSPGYTPTNFVTYYSASNDTALSVSSSTYGFRFKNTDINAQGICIMRQPIMYNTSFQIKVYVATTAMTNNLMVSCNGGVI